MLKNFTYRHGNKKKPWIGLTFDDGPSDCTPRVLDALKAHGIHATFFVIPENVHAPPHVAMRIVDEGHEIGGHCAQPAEFNIWHALHTQVDQKRIRHVKEELRTTLGISIHLFRPSIELACNKGVTEALEREHLLPILASAYSRVHKPIEVQINRIKKDIKPGAIILLHDGHDSDIHAPRPQSLNIILPAIIECARLKNLEFVPVSKLLDVPPYL